MSQNAKPASPKKPVWTTEAIRKLVQEKFKKRACHFQIEVARALYEGKDVVGCAPTGAGKTLSFWIPLLMALADGRKNAMSIIVTPLNVLGKQNEQILEEAGIKSVAVSRENANEETFERIAKRVYRVVVLNPELLMGNKTVQKWWKETEMTRNILNFTFDEGHCISQWGSFRGEYKLVGDLRHLVPNRIPFYVASATLPPPVLRDVSSILRLRKEETKEILRSNDRLDIFLMVKVFKQGIAGYRDLAFLVPPDVQSGVRPLKKFLVFFDDTKEAERACRWLQKQLPTEDLKKKVTYFHSTMTEFYRVDRVQAVQEGTLSGLCCTDAFGMGMDVPDIELVVQYKATCDMCTLWQRFGRAARAPGRTAVAILLVEKKNTEAERLLKAERASKKEENKAPKPAAVAKGPKDGTRRMPLAPKNTNVPAMGPSTDGLGKEASTDGNDESPVNWVAEYRKQYHHESTADDSRKPKPRGKGRESRAVVVGSAMDHYINPPNDPGLKRCRRFFVMLYMDSDRRDVPNEHKICDPTRAEGCSRCRPLNATVCCDICHPDAECFQQYMHELEPAPRNAGKSQLRKFKPTTADEKLKAALYAWRRHEATQRFEQPTLKHLGSKLLMGDDVIDRLVACFHHNKPLSSTNDILRETGWTRESNWLDGHGPSLLKVLEKHFTHANTAKAQAQSAAGRKARYKCAQCKQEGHNVKTCPLVLAERAYPSAPAPATPARLPAPQTVHNPDVAGPSLPSLPSPSLPTLYEHLRTPTVASSQNTASPYMLTPYYYPTYNHYQYPYPYSTPYTASKSSASISMSSTLPSFSTDASPEPNVPHNVQPDL